MNARNLLLFACLLLLLTPLCAQQHRVMLSYFGEGLTHPGISVGHNLIMQEWVKERTTKKGKTKQKTYSLAINNRFAFYNHNKNHTGLLLATGFSFSRVKNRGPFISIGPFVGAMQRILNEDTYTVDKQGNVHRLPLASNFNGIVGLSTRLGKDFSKIGSNNQIGWFLGSNLFVAFPFGTTFIIQNAIELGVFYKI